MAIRPEFNFIELCAGGGMLGVGVKLALEHLGFNSRCVCYVEREGHAAATLVARMEEEALDTAPVWDCVESFDGRAWRGRVHGVVAGIPCQGNSLAGKRLLGDDHRNLWPATRRILRDLDCDRFLLENVYGILVPGDEREAPVARILGELAEDGFDAEWIVLPASAVGAFHERARVFLLAKRRGGKLRRRGRGPADDGSELADGSRQRLQKRPGQRRNLREQQQAADGSGGALATGVDDATDSGHRREVHQQSAGRSGHADEAGAAVPGDLADAECQSTGTEQWPRSRGCTGTESADQPVPAGTGPHLPLFAPARSDIAAWLSILSADPTLVPALPRKGRGGAKSSAQAAESEVRGLADGMAAALAERADMLRLCGNGVVSLQAAIAFYVLWNRFED